MRQLATCLVLIIACGCGPSIDPQLQPYLSRFVSDADRFGRPVDVSNISLEFGDPKDQNLWGVCNSVCRATYKIVLIRRSAWDRIDDLTGIDVDVDRNKAMVYHELGHCMLGLHHETGYGIMQSNSVPGWYLAEHEEALLEHLFRTESDC